MSRTKRFSIVAGIACAVALLAPFTSHGQNRTITTVAVTPANPAELRQWDARIADLTRNGELRSRGITEDTLIAGRSHERFDQYYRGVRISGGDIVRQSDHGVAVSVFGTIYESLTLDVTPTLSAAAARERMLAVAGASEASIVPPELLILPLDDGTFALVYRDQVVTEREGAIYFIDAKDGRVRLKQNLFQNEAAVVTGTGVLRDTKKISVNSQAGSFVADDQLRPPSLRTFDLRGNLTRTINVLNGVTALANSDLAGESSSSWTDGPNVDAHTYEGYTYDYYFKRFGRRGLDNANNRIIGITHPVALEDFQIFQITSPGTIGTFYLNAFYCGSCGVDGRGMMVYGVGLPSNIVLIVGNDRVGVRNFAAAIDVIAHELTHGVTAFSSRLGGANEPGALNEAFSDMMGTGVEFFFQPAGSGLQRADYLLGEDLTTQNVAGLTRSMADPQSLGTPDNYSRRLLDPADNGEVHNNSTIASHAFYLAIEGGTNRTSGLAVQGVGAANRDQIEKVFYRGFTMGLTSNATFALARAATIQSARDLYGTGSAAERAVTQAWTAVGVN